MAASIGAVKQQMQNHSFSPSNKNFYLLRFVFCELIKTLNTHTQTHTLWPLPAQGHPRGPPRPKLTPPSHVVGLQSVKLGVSVPTGTGVAPTPASLPLHPGLEAPEGNLGLHPQSSGHILLPRPMSIWCPLRGPAPVTLHQGAAWIQLARRNSPALPLSFIPLVLPSRSPRMEAILLGLAQARGQPSSWPAPFRAPPNPPQAFLNVHGGRWVPEKDCPATSRLEGRTRPGPSPSPEGLPSDTAGSGGS